MKKRWLASSKHEGSGNYRVFFHVSMTCVKGRPSWAGQSGSCSQVPASYVCPTVAIPVAGVGAWYQAVLCRCSQYRHVSAELLWFTASSFLPLPLLQEWCRLAAPVSVRLWCQPCLWSCAWMACELRAAQCPPVSLLLLQPGIAALPFWSQSKLSCAYSVLILALSSFGTLSLAFRFF